MALDRPRRFPAFSPPPHGTHEGILGMMEELDFQGGLRDANARVVPPTQCAHAVAGIQLIAQRTVALFSRGEPTGSKRRAGRGHELHPTHDSVG